MMILIFLSIIFTLSEPAPDSTLIFRENIDYEVSNFKSKISSYNPFNGDIYLYRNALVRIAIDGKIDTLAYELFEEGEIFRMDTHPKGDRLRFWDSGVGRVFDFYLDELKLERKDTSHNHRNMFGHAAYVDNKGGIYAMGGYGYWSLENLLVRFDPNTGQWEEVVPVNRQLIPKAQDGTLFTDNDFIYYLVINRDEKGITHALFKLDKRLNVWNKDKKGSYLLRSQLREFGSTFRYNSTYSIDKENSIVAYVSENDRKSTITFYDFAHQKRYIFNAEQHGMYDPRAVYYSEQLKQWIVLSHGARKQDRTKLNIQTIDFANILENTVPETAPFWVVRPLFYAITFMIFLSLLLLSIYKVTSGVVKHNKVVTDRADKNGIKIIYETNKLVQVVMCGKIVDLADQTLRGFWTFILHAAHTEKNQITLDDFDSEVLVHIGDNSQRARIRSKLFEMVNNEISKPFIYTIKSEYDKRVKVIKIDYSRLDIKNHINEEHIEHSNN